MKVYEGSIWVAAYASVSGALIAAQNLSDLTNVATARTNLGLGTAATTAATDYATAAQGALADSATQPGDNVSTLTNDAGYLTSFTETDPVFVAHPSYGITSTKITNWDTAYGWGNHASAGYLTSYTETDPVFTAHPAYGIDGTDISNWNDSFSFVAGFPTQSGNTGKFLTTDGSALSWGTVSTVGTLDDLTDVTITTPANGEVLKYNGTAWVNSTVTQSTLSFPFYNSAGTADSIALVSNQYLPFYNSAGSASNIAVTSI
jgi:hypothetical protein